MDRLIVVSNRTPIGAPTAGGLAVALRAALSDREGFWLGWSGSHAPHPQASIGFKDVEGIRVGGIDLNRDDFNAFYAGFSNSVLWPAFHLRLDLAHFETAWYEGYRRVNTRFAAALRPELRPGDIVWVHDYHLIPLATELRRMGVQNRIGFFLHIPFPTQDAFFAIPHHEELLADLLHYDLVGLQAQRDVAALREIIDHSSPETPAAPRPAADLTRARIAAFPIGSDPEAFAALATSVNARRMLNRMSRSLRGSQLILGVDRLDYSKGLPQRIEAYEKLLDYNAGLRRQVHLLQVAPPSRDMIPEYQAMSETLDAICGRVMGRFSEPDWQPLTYVKRPYSQSSLAGLYRLARVGLVTPLRDGMNLVAHEYVAAQDPANPGALVLSRFAGAAEIFPDALQVNPFDSDETAEALRVALAMPQGERIERWEALIAAARRHSVGNWSAAFLEALSAPGAAPKKPGSWTRLDGRQLQKFYADLRVVHRQLKAHPAPPAGRH